MIIICLFVLDFSDPQETKELPALIRAKDCMKYFGPQKKTLFKIIGINTLLRSFLSICANAKEYSFNYKQLDVGFPAQSRNV